MKYYSILALTLLIIFPSCKSHQKMEESIAAATDSCIEKRDLRIQTVKNLERNESTTSNLIQEQMMFCEGVGEIQIHQNGDVSIKGLKSAHLVRHEIHKQSATAAATNDSLTAKSHTKSSKEASTATKSNATIPVTSPIRHKILLFIGLIIILILLTRRVLKRFFN